MSEDIIEKKISEFIEKKMNESKKNARGAGRKKKVPEDGKVIEILEEKEEPIELSYHKAKQKLRKPRVLSEKQKENLQRLIELNKKRREEAKEAKEKKEELEKAKLKKKTYVIKPKRPYNKKQFQSKDLSEDDTSEDLDSEDDKVPEIKSNKLKKKVKVYNDETDSESTDTRQIKKKINHIKTIDNKIQQVKTNPYLNMLRKAGF